MAFKNINRKRVVLYQKKLSMIFKNLQESGELCEPSNYPYYFEHFEICLTYLENKTGLLKTWDHYCYKINQQKFYFKIVDPQKFMIAKIKHGI